MKIEDTKSLAWIGDAILSLYARKWILDQSSIHAKEREEVFQSMTTNAFLSHWGEPTKVESKIGKIFEEEGLEKAMHYIELNILPIVIKRQKQKNNLVATKKKSLAGRNLSPFLESIKEKT